MVYRPPWTDRRRLIPVGQSFNFEQGGLAAWTTEGVFRDGLTDGAREGQRTVVDLGGGGWLVSSWGLQGDADRGRAVSPPFEIEGDVITLRVGGGRLPGEVGVRLWVEDRIVRTAVGSQSEVLVQREWDVRDLRGPSARLELFDHTLVAWGHVLLDEVHQFRVEGGPAPRLRDFPAAGPQEPAASRRAAEQEGLPEK